VQYGIQSNQTAARGYSGSRIESRRQGQTDDKNIEDHVPCYQANLKSTESEHQALKFVELRTNDELYFSAC